MEYASVVTNQHDDQTLLYRYLENILSQETEALENLNEDDASFAASEKNNRKLLQLTRNFQNIKELLLVYEKQVVKWAAETKLFLLTQSDILEIKQEAVQEDLPIEDFLKQLKRLIKEISLLTANLPGGKIILSGIKERI